jgi:hypothetical protein
LADASVKIGRTNSAQPGEMPNTADPRCPLNIPATNVPCIQATLFTSAQLPIILLEISFRLSVFSSGCSVATGPSIKAIAISGTPMVRSIGADNLTRSKSPE